MKSTFENSAAFEPMFDEIVSFLAKREYGDIVGSFRACVMPIQDMEAVFDDSVQSHVQRFSVLIPNSGASAWLEGALGSRPQVGDVIEFKSGIRAAVTKVSTIADSWFEMEARQC